VKKFFQMLSVLIVIIFLCVGLVTYWPYIFARTVNGVISDVQRVAPPALVVGGGLVEASSRELFSYAVAIKEKSGEIVTASSEDRQWAVAQPGQCAEAKYYPYPPWKFDKSGTYFGARLLKLHVCSEGKFINTTPPAAAPAPVAPESSQPTTPVQQ
jgi:hypothetical protein